MRALDALAKVVFAAGVFWIMGTLGGYEQDLLSTTQFVGRCLAALWVLWISGQINKMTERSKK